MMGSKKRVQVRDELTQELVRSDLEPAAWYEQLLQKLQSTAQPDPADLETLRLIRDALASLHEPVHAGDR